MEKLVSKIVLYLDYLNKDCRLNVSVHFDGGLLLCLPKNTLHSLRKYNSHTNPYCIAVKKRHHNKCIAYQREIITSCATDPHCRVCHALVYERIYPLLKNKSTVGFVAVSGYKKKAAENSNIANKDLWKASLSSSEIPVSLCDAVIPPLQIMLEQLLAHFTRETPNEYNMIVQFLNEYHTNITLSDLCSHFNRSSSYISHMFKRESGVTLREYCNNLKLEDAKKLLTDTDRSVTEIAFDTGFNDASYFIYLFRKKYAVTPLQYRNSAKFPL